MMRCSMVRKGREARPSHPTAPACLGDGEHQGLLGHTWRGRIYCSVQDLAGGHMPTTSAGNEASGALQRMIWSIQSGYRWARPCTSLRVPLTGPGCQARLGGRLGGGVRDRERLRPGLAGMVCAGGRRSGQSKLWVGIASVVGSPSRASEVSASTPNARRNRSKWKGKQGQKGKMKLMMMTKERRQKFMQQQVPDGLEMPARYRKGRGLASERTWKPCCRRWRLVGHLQAEPAS
ncbi:hypothetical protein V8C26DRAFT_387805 [Trichoderma gracile]